MNITVTPVNDELRIQVFSVARYRHVVALTVVPHREICVAGKQHAPATPIGFASTTNAQQ
jgi:hypothetical protein